jgi:hypothetical protein
VPNDDFGESVAINGNTVIVGSPGRNSKTGAAYLFSLEVSPQGLLAPTWVRVLKLTASDSTGFADFGLSVTLDANFVAVGAHGGIADNGGLYVFSLTGSLL